MSFDINDIRDAFIYFEKTNLNPYISILYGIYLDYPSRSSYKKTVYSCAKSVLNDEVVTISRIFDIRINFNSNANHIMKYDIFKSIISDINLAISRIQVDPNNVSISISDSQIVIIIKQLSFKFKNLKSFISVVTSFNKRNLGGAISLTIIDDEIKLLLMRSSKKDSSELIERSKEFFKIKETSDFREPKTNQQVIAVLDPTEIFDLSNKKYFSIIVND